MKDKNKTKKVGGNNELNYSLGVLIILLMVFWFVCKCIGNDYKSYYVEPMAVNDVGLYYGNSPIAIGGNYGLPYIRSVNNVIEVPNSKTAMRNLYDEYAYKCGSLERGSNIDDKQVAIHLSKRPNHSINGPRSKTESRELTSESGRERDIG
jgi:hypothetical protein